MWSWSSLAGMATHWHVGAALLNLSWTRYTCTCRKMGELDVYPLQFTLVRHQPVTRGRAGRGQAPSHVRYERRPNSPYMSPIHFQAINRPRQRAEGGTDEHYHDGGSAPAGCGCCPQSMTCTGLCRVRSGCRYDRP
jgi:hypothetical protein